MQDNNLEIFRKKDFHQKKTLKIAPDFQEAWITFYKNNMLLSPAEELINKPSPSTIATISESKILQRIENNFFLYHQFEPIFQHHIKMCTLLLQEKNKDLNSENLQTLFSDGLNVQHTIIMFNSHLYRTIREAADFLNLSQNDITLTIETLPNKTLLNLRFQDDDVMSLQKIAQEQTLLFYDLNESIFKDLVNGKTNFEIHTAPLTNGNIINSLSAITSKTNNQSLYEHLINEKIVSPSYPITTNYPLEPEETLFNYLAKTPTAKYALLAKKLLLTNQSLFIYTALNEKIKKLIDIQIRQLFINNPYKDNHPLYEMHDIAKKLLLNETLEKNLKEKDGKSGNGKI